MVNQRTKGHSWERKIANDLKVLDPDCKRLLEYQQGFGIDISTKLPLRVQCKSGMSTTKAFHGLKEAGNELGKYSVCAFKWTHKGEYAVLNWDDFLDLFKSWMERGLK